MLICVSESRTIIDDLTGKEEGGGEEHGGGDGDDMRGYGWGC